MKKRLFILSDIYLFFYFITSYLKHNLKGVRVTPSCKIDYKALLAPSSSFFGYTNITENVIIGKHTYATDATIQNAVIGNFCSIAPGVKIGLNEHPLNEVLLHPSGYDSATFNKTIAQTIIGNDVWLCANAVILTGVKIGDGSVIAAGAVVTSDVPPFSICGGVPAKIIGKRNQHPLFDELVQKGDLAEIKKRWIN